MGYVCQDLRFWNLVRSLEASGSAVSNALVAKAKGCWPEEAKLMLENDIPPEETSGTPERVAVEVSQVMVDWRAVTMSWVSAGREVLPIMKQGGDCLVERGVGAWGVLLGGLDEGEGEGEGGLTGEGEGG